MGDQYVACVAVDHYAGVVWNFGGPFNGNDCGDAVFSGNYRQWERRPPDSETTAPALANSSVQLASEYGIMRTSPGETLLRSAVVIATLASPS